jgi:hypothetical protein
LYVIYSYVTKSRSVRENFKREAKRIFRKDFITYLNSKYDLYLIRPKSGVDIDQIVAKYFKLLNGKIFSQYRKGEDLYGEVILGLEKSFFEDNTKLLNVLVESFDINIYDLE